MTGLSLTETRAAAQTPSSCRVECEDEDAEEKNGTLLRVPPPLYRPVAERLAEILREPFTGQKWRMVRSQSVSTDSYNEHSRR